MHTHATQPYPEFEPVGLPLPETAPSAGRRASVAVVHDLASLSWLVPSWEDLAANAVEPNVFYEHWMLRPALDAFSRGRNVSLVLVLLHDGSHPGAPATLGGLFPLERLDRTRRLPLASCRIWRHPHCFLCTPLVRRDAAEDALCALLDWLRSEGIALTEFADIAEDGPFAQALAKALRSRPYGMRVTQRWQRALLSRTDQGALEPAASRDFRKDVRRKERRLGELGSLRHMTLEPGDDVQRWIQDFLRLEASGWKGRRGSALACSLEHRRFFVAIATAAHRRGRLLMHGIDLDGKPIARSCDFVSGSGAFAFKTAFDEGYSRYSPGVLLEYHNVACVARIPGVEWMDSCSAQDNLVLNRLWNDRRTMHSVSIGTGPAGRLIVGAWPLLRWARRLGNSVIK